MTLGTCKTKSNAWSVLESIVIAIAVSADTSRGSNKTAKKQTTIGKRKQDTNVERKNDSNDRMLLHTMPIYEL